MNNDTAMARLSVGRGWFLLLVAGGAGFVIFFSALLFFAGGANYHPLLLIPPVLFWFFWKGVGFFRWRDIGFNPWIWTFLSTLPGFNIYCWFLLFCSPSNYSSQGHFDVRGQNAGIALALFCLLVSGALIVGSALSNLLHYYDRPDLLEIPKLAQVLFPDGKIVPDDSIPMPDGALEAGTLGGELLASRHPERVVLFAVGVYCEGSTVGCHIPRDISVKPFILEHTHPTDSGFAWKELWVFRMDESLVNVVIFFEQNEDGSYRIVLKDPRLFVTEDTMPMVK
jgi:hypothetical protein